MDISITYEIIGYVASVLVAVSLMMRSVFKLRVINLLGAAVFTAYGLLIDAYPVAAMNLFIVFIDLYYLREFVPSKDSFSLPRAVNTAITIMCLVLTSKPGRAQAEPQAVSVINF